MYIVHTSFVSLETTFYLRIIIQGFVDPIMQHKEASLYAELLFSFRSCPQGCLLHGDNIWDDRDDIWDDGMTCGQLIS